MKPGRKKPEVLAAVKERFLDALSLPNVYGLLARASRKTKITMVTALAWCDNDPEFAAKVKKIRDLRKHTAEEALHELVERRDPSCTSFVNRCLNREEYTPANDLKVSGDSEAPLTIKLDESAVATAIANYYASNPDARSSDKPLK